MKKFFVSLVLVFVGFQFSAYGKEVKIKKTTLRKPSQATDDAYLANSTFTEFFKCARFEKEAEALKCVRRYFTAETSEAMVLRYSEAFRIATEVTELFYCDDETKKNIEAFEDPKSYDFYLCFQSNVSAKGKNGVAYFKKSSGMPKLNRLQM